MDEELLRLQAAEASKSRCHDRASGSLEQPIQPSGGHPSIREQGLVLQKMGFSEDDALAALVAADGVVEDAVDIASGFAVHRESEDVRLDALINAAENEAAPSVPYLDLELKSPTATRLIEDIGLTSCTNCSSYSML